LTDWDDIGYNPKKLTHYEKYMKRPDWWWDHFVGPRKPRGGKRKGAGRPSTKKEETPKEGLTIVVKLNNIQTLSLKELGDGDIEKGVQALIDKHL
jgi:hypothetical protein